MKNKLINNKYNKININNINIILFIMNSVNLPWIEKYRPSDIIDILSHT
jgi:hypothetical protein